MPGEGDIVFPATADNNLEAGSGPWPEISVLETSIGPDVSQEFSWEDISQEVHSISQQVSLGGKNEHREVDGVEMVKWYNMLRVLFSRMSSWYLGHWNSRANLDGRFFLTSRMRVHLRFRWWQLAQLVLQNIIRAGQERGRKRMYSVFDSHATITTTFTYFYAMDVSIHQNRWQILMDVCLCF